MTYKLSNIGTLSISYLLVITIVITSRCDGAGTDGADRPAADGGPLAGFANLGNFGEAGGQLGNMFKSMTDGANTGMLTDFMSSFTGPKVLAGTTGGSNSADKREGGSKKEGSGGGSSTGLMDIKDPMDFFKLMLNPMEFMNRLAREFKLDRTEFTQAVGRGMNFGLETALQPPMVCIKIIEKVFVPDQCKLKFICDMGKQMAMFKGQMPKFPDSYFEGASTAKAIYDGASGRECEHVYACEEGDGLKLKKEFAGLKNKFGSGSGSSKSDQSEYAAASQQSRVTAKGPAGVNKS